jgi:hypothetical protein
MTHYKASITVLPGEYHNPSSNTESCNMTETHPKIKLIIIGGGIAA